MEKTDVVTAFLVHRQDGEMRVLVLRRSDRVGTYRGRWAGISGYLESDSALDQALVEIKEEAGLRPDGVRLLAAGPPLEILDESIETHWRVHPFLFEVRDPEAVRIDWEHTESRWVEPEALRELETVPGLADGLESLLSQEPYSGSGTKKEQ